VSPTWASLLRRPAELSISEVSLGGVSGRGERDAVLEVFFDDRSVWAFRFLRDSEPAGSERLVPWPMVLRPRLDGAVRVRVNEHSSGAVLYDREVRFGSGQGRIVVTDGNGRPLAVNSKGRLAAPLSQRGPQVVATVLDAAEDVLAVMRGAGVEGFLAYGTLLGAVRTGHVIAHDYDADLGYLSSREYPVDAITESYRLERAIRSRGYCIRRYSAMAFQVVLDSTDPQYPWLDVFGSLIVGDMLYVLWDVAAPLRRDQVLPLGTCALEGRDFSVPRDVDAWLTATYGPSWRVPDPAFHFDTPRSTRRRLSGWFGRLNRGRHPWDLVHELVDVDRVDEEPSGFARWVDQQEPDADVVVDVGCGVGTDALSYARSSVASKPRTVLGLDFSEVALAKARARAERTVAAVSFRLVNLADLRSVLVQGAVLARLPGRRVLTARFVADTLTGAERAYLWLLASMALRGAGVMYVEVALARDPRQPEFASAHRLRKLPEHVLRAEVEAAGGTIHERLVSPSSPASTDPDTIRMVLSWPR